MTYEQWREELGLIVAPHQGRRDDAPGAVRGRTGTGARPALTVPREIKDEATGEMLDVVQDNDPDLPPESDLQESEDTT